MKNPLPGFRGEGLSELEDALVVVFIRVNGGRVVEVARRTNRLLTGEGPRKAGSLIPVVMADGVRVFGVGFVLLASKDFSLFLEPGNAQSRGRRAAHRRAVLSCFDGSCGRTGRARS